MVVLGCAASAANTASGVGSGDAVAPARGAGSAADPACAAPAGAVEETFTARNAFGVIEGTLLLPAACGPRPVALIIAGSGPTDRNGNQAQALAAQPYRLLATALAAASVAATATTRPGSRRARTPRRARARCASRWGPTTLRSS